MASFLDRLSNKEYKNWLKAGIGLRCLKEGLEPFVEEESKKLHRDIAAEVNKSLDETLNTSRSCNHCQSRNVRIEKTSGWWKINCSLNVCNQYVSEIIKYHVQAMPKCVNWTNGDVQKWPFEHWNIAKVFMHSGMETHVLGPKETDCLGLLNFIINCKRFQGKINVGFADKVRRARNATMHAASMSVSDTDMSQWLTDMIHLIQSLVDFKDREEAKKAAERIDEIRNVDFKLTKSDEDLVLLERTKVLEEKLKDLQLTTEVDSENMWTRISTMEEAIQNIQNQLPFIETVVETNPDLQTEELKERLHTISETCLTSQQLLERLVERTASVDQEAQRCQNAAPPEPRDPMFESMHKKTLQQINNRLKKCFVKTSLYQKASDYLETHGSVVISGRPGEGKTTTSIQLLASTCDPNRCLILTDPTDWGKLNLNRVDAVVIDDIFGTYDVDEGRVNSWLSVMDSIQACVEERELKVIISTRQMILNICQKRLTKFPLFKQKVYLSSNLLTPGEKEKILETVLQQAGKTLSSKIIRQCVRSFVSHTGFPYCCVIFSGDKDLFDQGAAFFQKPNEFYLMNLKTLNRLKLFSLIFLFYCGGRINRSYFMLANEKEKLRVIVEDIADSVEVSQAEKSFGKIQTCLQDLSDLYVESNVNEYTFYHNIIYETIGVFYGTVNPIAVLRTCSLDFLCQCITVGTTLSHSSSKLHINGNCYSFLANRIIDEVVNNKEVRRISHHPAFLDKEFVQKLFETLKERNETDNFLTTDQEHCLDETICYYTFPELLKSKSTDIRAAAEECIRCLSCDHEVRSGSDLEDCWKCSQKRKALFNSFANGDKSLPVFLMEHGAFAAKHMLWNCIESGSADLLGAVIHQLKKLNEWDPNHHTVHSALKLSFRRAYVGMTEMLLDNGARIAPYCLTDSPDKKRAAIRSSSLPDTIRYSTNIESAQITTTGGNETVPVEQGGAEKGLNDNVSSPLFAAVIDGKLQEVAVILQNLKADEKLISTAEELNTALQLSYSHGFIGIAQLLIKFGAPVEPACLCWAVQSGNLDAVKDVLERLKNTNQLQASHNDIRTSLKWSHEWGHEDIKSHLFGYLAAKRKEKTALKVLYRQTSACPI